MRILAAALVIATVALGAPAGAADNAEPQAGSVLKATLESYIRPSYAALGERASQLRAATGKLCETASGHDLQDARQAFGGLVDAWSRIEWLRTGPVMADNRLERILFYPDRKSTGLKQVQRAIASGDETAADFDALAGASVAMQGLGAIEYLLFGSGNEALLGEPQSHRCRYALAVAANLQAIAGEIARAWSEGSPLSEAFLEPAGDNPLFRDGREALNLVLATMIHGLEAIRDIRIGAFLKEDGRDRPLVAVYRRSGLTLRSVTADLEGLLALFDDSDLQHALPADGAGLADQVRFEFAQSIRTAKSLDESAGGDIETLLADKTRRQKLAYLQLSIRYVIERLNDEIAPAAGLSAGFSFGDGD
ncbi:MAG: peptidase M75, Imelysin [Nitratireductor sp.]|nr:peptidase M75, Imelysin [Nitratireductor sp.]